MERPGGQSWQEVADLSASLANEEQAERVTAEKARQREQQRAERRAATDQRRMESRLSTTEGRYAAC
jgi:hypothetical protein